ncbi:DUF2933 domain-containing protein [Pseudooceanicola sediminis]|uniref:DUF2933 domain-containing protein n=1 Tax=Pseudooceanicola sediminis TaxID=2211117 RepID=A0A399IVT1_9RHOB|nr:DUF2933 domain-containing protein [Pseudooceanicola sediminis]KAA2312226.1 DUF2933 domain-containing protein [Puniceibacterium sp. HSS470]MCB1469500.1 DUF2933 domain-containing protein [Rhizobiaceae bacterium]RII37268.1 DUF2933 domain-containing protein [Pseudooceanicola sediminis]|tara:strand:- start:176 stop:469 length:294 start_codon:yes stop_codon:yes gene_type:complete
MRAEDEKNAKPASEMLMKYGMWICCAVMVLPIMAYLVAGGISGASEGLFAVAPLLLCVGAHLVMHRMMGKSCHGSARKKGAGYEADGVRETAKIAAE